MSQNEVELKKEAFPLNYHYHVHYHYHEDDVLHLYSSDLLTMQYIYTYLIHAVHMYCYL